MHAADILAYTLEGAVFCDDCKPSTDDNPEMGAWFADNEDELISETCDSCRACYTPDGWTPHEDAVGPDYRWSRCAACNSQRPYRRDDSEARLRALQRKLICDSCRKPTVHFEARNG